MPKKPTKTQTEIMTAVNLLRDRGCAVVVWTEKELRGLDVDIMEDAMLECGSEAILMHIIREAEAS